MSLELLFSSTGHRRKPGPKGSSPELIATIVALKSCHPKFGGVSIAQEIAAAFNIELNKEVVRRVLEKHYNRLLFHYSVVMPANAAGHTVAIVS